MENTQEEMKHKLQEAVESFARGISEAEKDLQEAKTSAENLIEKIDEYFETLNPKFKVGDYVTLHAFHKEIAKIEKIEKIEKIYGKMLHGIWYDTESESIRLDYYFGGGTVVKHATPTEIAEYESALSFHEHGRNPFELKKGDLIRKPSGNFTFILIPENYTKEDFLKYGWEFLKTAEEFNEWLGADDE